MDTFSALLALCVWPVDSLHKGQWRGALMFSLILTWINNREAGDLIHHRVHYDATVMWWTNFVGLQLVTLDTTWPRERMFTKVVHMSAICNQQRTRRWTGTAIPNSLKAVVHIPIMAGCNHSGSWTLDRSTELITLPLQTEMANMLIVLLDRYLTSHTIYHVLLP